MNIHDKMKIGWIRPKIVRGHLSKCLAFPAVESTKAALVVLSPRAGAPTDEYWIVENRHPPSSTCNGCAINFDRYEGVFDNGIPDSGLAVWWVKTGTWPLAHLRYDDVRLVDATDYVKDPDGPQGVSGIQGPNPGFLYPDWQAWALFGMHPIGNPYKVLLDGTGTWSLLYFGNLSNAGPIMYGTF